MVKKQKQYTTNQEAMQGVIGLAMIIIACIIAAPFTSWLVPIVIGGFFAIEVCFLVLYNLFSQPKKNPLLRAMAQESRIASWIATYLRF